MQARRVPTLPVREQERRDVALVGALAATSETTAKPVVLGVPAELLRAARNPRHVEVGLLPRAPVGSQPEPASAREPPVVAVEAAARRPAAEHDPPREDGGSVRHEPVPIGVVDCGAPTGAPPPASTPGVRGPPVRKRTRGEARSTEVALQRSYPPPRG